MKKRLLSILLVLCMTLALLPPETARAADIAYPVTGGNIYFSAATGAITDCDESVTEAIIPSEINGTPVTSIGHYAFGRCKSLTSITIPGSVTSIEYEAFYSSSNLTNVTIPDNVISIGRSAFAYCSSLTSVTIPSGVTKIEDSTFSGCSSLVSVIIPDGVTSIGNAAFSNCQSLPRVNIPNSVASIGSNAFSYCYSLTNITIPNSVTSIESAVFYLCSNLTGVTIPDSVTSIGERAFGACSNLANVTIPNNVSSIEEGAFWACDSLTDINVTSGNTAYSSVDGVLFNADQTVLHTYPAGKSETSYSIPVSVTNIAPYAFAYSNSLATVSIPNGVTSIEEGTFECSNSLTSITIPNGVTNIGSAAFDACYDLTRVTIPVSVTSIGEMAFHYCRSLEDVYYGGSENQWAIIDGNSELTDATIHYNSTGPGTDESGAREYIYDTTDPGADVILDVDRLNKVTDPATAAEAVRDQVNGMTQAQKESATGIDLATLYAEASVAKAASKSFTGTDILINAAAVADLEAEAAQAVTAVETALVNGGIATARYLSNTVTLTTTSTSEITIRLDPDILTTSVDKVRVEGPSYALTFKVADWADTLTEVLTFKAAPVNPGARAAVSSVNIDLPGGSSSNPVTVSLPTDTGTDTTYQAVVGSTGSATASKYNPATTNIDGKVNTSGTYTVETKEVDFTDIANKSAEMQKAIKYLAARDILGGTGDNKFSPDASISRAELTKLVVMALGKLDNGATCEFNDVTKADWFYPVVASSQKLGYIGGYEDNTFRGKSVISKNEIVVIAGRVLGTEMNYKMPDNAASYLGKYSDTVATWAQPQVALATMANLVVYRTDGTFSGAKDMTRGDAAIVLYRLFQKLW